MVVLIAVVIAIALAVAVPWCRAIDRAPEAVGPEDCWPFDAPLT